MIKLPTGVEINKLIDDLRVVSWDASHILLQYSQILKDSSDKSNILENDNINDPVTKADLKVNELIIKQLTEKYEGVNWGILSEENVKLPSYIFDKNYDWMWVLDPLDGTKDFIQGTSNYAMHLSLNYRQKPYLGIVLIPEKNELWIANGEEIWCEKKNRSRLKPKLSGNKSLREMVLVTSKNHGNKTLRDLIERIDFKDVKIMGSIGCKIASIVRGESDIYICLSLPKKNSPKDWDFSAPEAILKAAGGSITNIYNEELTYGKNNFEQGGIIVASNNNFLHEDICLEIRHIIERYNLYPL